MAAILVLRDDGRGQPIEVIVEAGADDIVHREVDEQSLSTQLHDRDYFTQRLILGCKEYATHINFIDGRVVSELTVEYVFATAQSIKGKDRALNRYVHCPDLTALVTILHALNYEGLCCFNYKIVDGVGPVVFELNRRFGGKGLIARILRALIGQENSAGCSLKDLGQTYGLEYLLGKILAVFPDVRFTEKKAVGMWRPGPGSMHSDAERIRQKRIPQVVFLLPVRTAFG